MLHAFFPSLRRPVRAARVLVAGTFVALAACDDDDVTVPETAATVEVTPRLVTVVAGQTAQLTAQAKTASGADLANDAVIWTSLDTNVARVSSSGLVTAIASGATAITASTRGMSGFASVEAVGVVASVEIDGMSSLPVQQSTQLSARALEANGRELFSPITWTSSDATVATVSSEGLVTTLAVGTATISAATAGKTGTLVFTVLPPPPVATVDVTPATGFLPTGVGVPLAVTLKDANGGDLVDRVVTYTSSDAAIATVSASGVVTAQAPGAVTITVTSEGKTATAQFSALTGVRSGATAITVANTQESENAFVAYREFAIYVPPGSTTLDVRLAGGTGDPDLYLFVPGNMALNSSWVCRSWNAGPGETCTITDPAPGVWRIIVDSYNAHAGTNLTATITPAPPGAASRHD